MAENDKSREDAAGKKVNTVMGKFALGLAAGASDLASGVKSNATGVADGVKSTALVVLKNASQTGFRTKHQTRIVALGICLQITEFGTPSSYGDTLRLF